eukprot:COSAG05_NODE_2762_length_2671_cov_21.788880_3_plen_126_part_00
MMTYYLPIFQLSEHGVSYAELRRRGIVPGKNIVDMKMLLTLKRKPDNTIDKMKGRNVACGHKGAIPKSSLSSVFSAAPDLAASRLLDCLGTMFIGTSGISLPPPKLPLEQGLPTSLCDDYWECGK